MITSRILYTEHFRGLDSKYEIPYIFTEKKYIDMDISISREVLRSIIINKLINIFIKNIKQLQIKNIKTLFKYNKIYDYIHKWCWLQYENKNIKDIVIPYIDNKIDELPNDLQ